jgi:hypothetical protein
MFRHRPWVETFSTLFRWEGSEVPVNARLIRIIATTGGALALAGGLAVGAPGASAGTAAYFQITGTGLAVSEPTATGGVSLGSVPAGTLTHQHALGDVTVNDGRALPLPLAVWTATVSSTDFVRDGAGATPAANEMVAKANIAYSAGTPSVQNNGVFTGGVVASMALPDPSRVAGAFAGLGGASGVTWNPNLTFTLLSSQVAGTYRGTITHSVA